MKAVVVPAPKQGYKIQEVEDPKAGKGEVVIKVRYAALCYRDLLQLQGYYPRMKYPVILGHEVVGEVEEVGEGVSGISKGDRVTSLLYVPDGECKYCKIGEEVFCKSRLGYAEELDGFFAERAKLKLASVIKLPQNVSDEGAVLAPCITGMVLGGIRRAGGINKDDLVLVTGASGGVGIHAIQVAKALGAKIIGVTTSEEKAKVVKNYADYVIVGSKFSEEAKKIGDVQMVIDTVGTPTIDESLKALYTGGKLVQIGNVDPSQVYNLRLGYIILKSIKIVGHVASTKKDIMDAIKLTAEGKINPVIAMTVKLDDVDKGFEALKDKRKVGKVLIKP